MERRGGGDGGGGRGGKEGRRRRCGIKHCLRIKSKNMKRRRSWIRRRGIEHGGKRERGSCMGQ